MATGTFHCGQSAQHLRSHQEAVHNQKPTQFIVTQGHTI